MFRNLEWLPTPAVALIFLLSNPCLASYQKPDRLELDGEVIDICGKPFLDKYLDKHNIEVPSTIFWSTGLTRGYIATFGFVDELLVVKDIHILVNNEVSEVGELVETWQSVLDGVLPEPSARTLTWFNGSLYYLRRVDEKKEGVTTRKASYYRIDVESGRMTAHTLYKEEVLEDGTDVGCGGGWG